MSNFIIAWENSIDAMNISEYVEENILPSGVSPDKVYSNMLLLKNMPSNITEEYLTYELNKIYLKDNNFIGKLFIYAKEIKSTLPIFPYPEDEDED